MTSEVTESIDSGTGFAWPPARSVLSAEWRHLIMLNYEIDPRVLLPMLPAGVEIDFWQGKTYVSIVGFLFRQTRLLGLRIPFHINFEELNLRFYVRRTMDSECRRGVVFVRELVPRRAIAFVARTLYAERYLAVPMSHRLSGDGSFDRPPRQIEYCWRSGGRDQRVAMETTGDVQPLAPESLEGFIAEHYWGYTALPHGRSREYLVAHPPWRISPATTAELDCDVVGLYGGEFLPYLSGPPASAFWAAGSPIRVYRGRGI